MAKAYIRKKTDAKGKKGVMTSRQKYIKRIKSIGRGKYV